MISIEVHVRVLLVLIINLQFFALTLDELRISLELNIDLICKIHQLHYMLVLIFQRFNKSDSIIVF